MPEKGFFLPFNFQVHQTQFWLRLHTRRNGEAYRTPHCPAMRRGRALKQHVREKGRDSGG